MGEKIAAKMELEQRLRLAIRDGKFCCAFQPKVDIHSQEVIGFETLVRWRDDAGEIQPPSSFIGLAIELGLIDPITHFVLSEAVNCIAGYTCVNDVTAVDLMNENADFVQWCRAKGSDTFGCIGPAIATQLDWRSARVVTRVDGVERQNYPLSDMIFSPDEQVSLLSRDMTLCPGDVIACGTSLGVGSIKDGATVDIEIDGIGTLSNRLTASPVLHAAAG